MDQDDESPKPKPSVDEESNDSENLDQVIQRRDEEETFEALKGDLPCLDSSAGCIKQLQDLAVLNNSTLKEIELQITQANDNIKIANQPRNIFQQAEPFLPLVGNAIFGTAGAAVQIIKNLAGQGDTNQKNAQVNADLQIKVSQLQQRKLEVSERLKDQVLQETIRFDELRRDADLQSAIAKREQARMKVIEISYRLGEGDTTSMISLLNTLDRTKGAASAARTRMRAQAEKMKRIVLSD